MSNRDPGNSFIFADSNKETSFKLYYGMTFYLNVSDSSNYDSTNNNSYNVAFLKGTSGSSYDVLEYNFENTLQRVGCGGKGFGSHLKFKVPSNLDSNTTFKMVNIDKFDNITDTFEVILEI